MHTPSSYMYSDLRSFGGITNKEAASELLTGQTLCGNDAPRDRIKEPFCQGRSFTQPQVRFILSFLAISIKVRKQLQAESFPI